MVVFSRAAVGASGLATVLFTSRLLPAPDRGSFATLQAATVVAAAVGSLSLWLGISLTLAEMPSGRRQSWRLSWGAATLLVLAIALGAAALDVCGVGLSPTWVLAFLFTTFLGTCYTNAQGIPIGLARMHTFAVGEIVRAVVSAGTVPAAIALGIRQPTQLIMVWGLGYVAGLGVLARDRQRLSAPLAHRGARTFLRSVLDRSLRGHVTNVLGLAILRLDILLLAVLAGARPVAYYSFAVSLAEGVWLVPGAIASVGLSDFARQSREASDSLVRRNVRRALVGAGIVAVMLGLVGAGLVLFVLDPTYQAALAPLFVCLVGTVAYSVTHAVNPWIVASLGRPGLSSVLTSTTLAVNIGLLLALSPLDALGASIATAVAYGLAAGLHLLYFSRVRRTL